MTRDYRRTATNGAKIVLAVVALCLAFQTARYTSSLMWTAGLGISGNLVGHSNRLMIVFKDSRSMIITFRMLSLVMNASYIYHTSISTAAAEHALTSCRLLCTKHVVRSMHLVRTSIQHYSLLRVLCRTTETNSNRSQYLSRRSSCTHITRVTYVRQILDYNSCCWWQPREDTWGMEARCTAVSQCSERFVNIFSIW